MKDRKNTIRAFILLHIVLFIYSISGIFSKNAAKHPFLSVEFIAFYAAVIFLLFFYALAWQQVIKRLPLIVAYANKAVTIIWGIVWGVLFFREKINVQQIIGAVIIVVGIYFVVSDMEEE